MKTLVASEQASTDADRRTSRHQVSGSGRFMSKQQARNLVHVTHFTPTPQSREMKAAETRP